MKKILFLSLIFFITQLSAQDYNVLLIPDSIKKKANVVERFEEIRIIIKDIDNAVVKHKYAYTILNETGKKYAGYYNSYSNLINLSNIDGNLYDASGKKLKTVKKKDIGDFVEEDGMSLATDARFKEHDFYYSQYPYTVEYEDEQEYNGIFYLPSWYTQPYLNFAVEFGRLIVETPTNYNLRYKQENYEGNPVINKTDNKIVYTWEVKNQKAKSYEFYGPEISEISTRVILAPTQFSIQGFTGTMNTWKDFGMFRQTLLGGRDELDDITKRKVHELTDGLKDPKEKIAVLYKYLQSNTRYVNITFGIGGWQPYDAKYVAEKKYGDCKALSNFMGALLKEAGINSYYTVIKSGKNNTGFYADFPSNQFNHVIRCVPLAADTIWLECTSQTLPAGYLGDFTCNRPALLITESGGKLVNTPNYTKDDNVYIRNIEGIINEKGDLNTKAITIYKGLEYDDIHDMFHYLKNEDVKKYLNNAFSIPNYAINDFKYSETEDQIPSIKEEISFTSGSYANISGKRLFIVPNILAKSPTKLDTSDARKYDIIYRYSFKNIDTFNIALPEGYTVEALPKNKSIINKFGKYEASYIILQNKIIYTRSYERTAGHFLPLDYAEFVNFYNEIYKADRSQVVLVKKESQ
jgi:hypothetical protein